jgi:lysophospholipase L1-like esterase
VWGEGIAASGQQALGFVPQLGRLLGWTVTNLGIGGTGWATDVTTGVTAVKFVERLADIYTAAPDVVLIPGSQNDKAAAVGAINTEVAASIAAIKTNLPSAKIILASTLFPAVPTTARGGFDVARRDVMDAEVRSAVDATTGVSYIDASGWFTGTGRVGTPDGGNADWFRTSIDWAHPSTEGHTYLARRFAAELKRIVV